jgi:hypothetical protein
MNHPLRTLAVCLVGLCTVLPAQEGEKPKPQEPAKAAGQAPSKAQEALAKDPAIQAIDKFIAEQKIDKARSTRTPTTSGTSTPRSGR